VRLLSDARRGEDTAPYLARKTGDTVELAQSSSRIRHVAAEETRCFCRRRGMVLEVGTEAAPTQWDAPPHKTNPVRELPEAAARPVPWYRVRRETLYLGLFICVLGYVVLHWVLWPVKISGESMLPNYDDGQPVFINRLAYLGGAPLRGDVVGVRVGKEFYLKRVIGLPGEKLEFHRDTVFVNGKPLVESYRVRPLLWRLPPVQLGANDYFVMGDNRPMSLLGPVRRDHIIGKSLF
jgi:signal peptidase I